MSTPISRKIERSDVRVALLPLVRMHCSFQVDTIRTILKREDLRIVDIKDPSANIDGGDVLFTGSCVLSSVPWIN